VPVLHSRRFAAAERGGVPHLVRTVEQRTRSPWLAAPVTPEPPQHIASVVAHQLSTVVRACADRTTVDADVRKAGDPFLLTVIAHRARRSP
jgi:hypothetical protein